MTRRALTRRTLLAGTVALLGTSPVRASGNFADTFDRARELRELHSLIIARGGKVLAAEAIRGPSLDAAVNVKSVSKSLISALTGIAIDRGELTGTDQRIAPLLGRWLPRRADPRVREITIGDLLTMRSGLTRMSGAAYGEWVAGAHWIYEALSKPMVADPGTEMLYSTASYHMLGAILAKVAGDDLARLAQDRLGTPLGIRIPPWTRDPKGRYLGGNDMRLSPDALLRFGETYRLGGRWDGAQVVPETWVAQSWTPYTTSPESGHDYGYGWYAWQAAGQSLRYARGYGGQMIYVAPELEMTVVVTSRLSTPEVSEAHFHALNAMLEETILPEAAAA